MPDRYSYEGFLHNKQFQKFKLGQRTQNNCTVFARKATFGIELGFFFPPLRYSQYFMN